MHIKLENPEPTKFKMSLMAEQSEIDTAKASALKKLSSGVKVPGFRTGKAPTNLIEKQIDPSTLQAEFLDQVINDLYVSAIDKEKLRPVGQPQIAITKFVPFTALEFTAEAEAVGDIKLPDYKKIKLAKKKVVVSVDEVNKLLDNLRQRAATKEEVKRTAKQGDEVTIDFTGSDADTNKPIEGASGETYPLIIGSNNFIPGFEEQLVGLKAGDEKMFDITFPSDYGTLELQNRKAKFQVKIVKVQSVKLPKLDEDFVKTLGPFKTVAELKADAKKELIREKEQQDKRSYENELLEKIADKTETAVPETLVQSELDRIEEEEKRDLAYRGQTWEEHLDAEKVSAGEHRQKNYEGAKTRVKIGLILGEVAEEEKITVTPDEFDTRLQMLRGQYGDGEMQSELDKPENQRDILNRMMTEKTLDYLTTNATKVAD